MALIATQTASDFKSAPEGTHIARCFSIIDLGTQHGEYQGAPTVRHECIVRWELPHEMVDIDGEQKPMVVSKFYTVSTSEKANLRRDWESWAGRKLTGEELLRGVDLTKLLGRPCQLSIQHNAQGKARVVAVTGLAKGMQCPPQYNDSLTYSVEQGRDDAFKALPAGFQSIIEKCEEWNGVKRTKSTASDRDVNGELQMAASDIDDDFPPF